MSYCRFGENSDIYCFEHMHGFHAVWVAKNRHNPVTDPPPSTTDAWFKWLEENRVPIDLPYAGEHFEEPDALSAYERLKQLQKLGYQVPQYALDALYREAQEEGLGEYGN